MSMETDILKELRALVIQGCVHEARAIAEKAIDGGIEADALI